MHRTNDSTLDTLLAERAWLRDLARALVRDPGLADDLHQETLLTAVRERPAAQRPRGWLAATLRNHLRTR